MGTYTWVQDRTNSLWTLGNTPNWYDSTQTAQVVATVPSPSGAGDILKRCELSARAGSQAVGNFLTLSRAWSLWTPSIRLLGEVFVAGNTTIPDPLSLGTESGVITACLEIDALAASLTDAQPGVVSFSTKGYVTSHGERGPAKYGSGHPELRVGMNVANVFDPNYVSSMDSWWSIHVRALWYTP